MKKLKYILVLFVFGLFLSVVYSSLSNRDAHSFEGVCNQCHLGMKNPSMLVAEPDRLCKKCHENQTNRSHPSNLIPKKQLPNIFPTFNSKLVCTSCHFAHAKFGDDIKKRNADKNPYWLRYKQDGKVFCFQCHKGDFSGASEDAHALSMSKAHLDKEVDSLTEIIGSSSRDCLSCHDGTLSSNTNVSMAGGATWEHSIGMSHPIGVSYDDAYRKKPKEYHNSASLDKRIKLVNGKIECETCHDHYSKLKYRLVMDNFRSRLCMSCHDL